MATPTYKLGDRAGSPYPTHISNEVRCQAVRRYGSGRTRCWRRYRTALPAGELVCLECAEAIRQGDLDYATLTADRSTEDFTSFLQSHIEWTGSDDDFITTRDIITASGVDISAQRAGKLLGAYIRSVSMELPSYRRGWRGYLGFRLK